jgi:ABC-2 type transport system ATP-binding protein
MLTVQNVSKRYGDLQAVDDLSFQVAAGEVFGLLGPNGSGKTTTVKMILGLLDPDAGTVGVDGIDPRDDSRGVKSIVGYVSEEAILFGSMTARDVFELVASVRGLDPGEADERVQRYLASFDVTDVLEKPLATLSRGQRQKVEITAALMHRPRLLILDEPLSGLDAKSVRVFKEILTLHTERGGAVLFSTHILEIAEELCDRICVIAAGKRLAMGTPHELRGGAAEGTRLEDVFLKLTDQDGSIGEIVRDLRRHDA